MANNLTRLKSTVWRVCMVLGLFPFVGVLLLMFIGRIGEIRRNDGVCIIGLQRFAYVFFSLNPSLSWARCLTPGQVSSIVIFRPFHHFLLGTFFRPIPSLVAMNANEYVPGFVQTALFVYPLHKGISPRLREVALRNLASSGVALATSCVGLNTFLVVNLLTSSRVS